MLILLYYVCIAVELQFDLILYIILLLSIIHWLFINYKKNLWFIWNIEILLKIENVWKELYIICSYIIFLHKINLTKIGSFLLILNSMSKGDSLFEKWSS